MAYGFLAGLFVILSSIIGSVIGLIIKNISHKTNDTLLGFAAGVMLSAAFLGLLPEAFSEGSFGMIQVFSVVGVIVGAFFISAIDKFVPHVHLHSDGEIKEDNPDHTGKNKIMLLIIAIAIHNIPEGLATGLAFSEGITKEGLVIALSMVIQKLPEGLIVAVPLLKSGTSKKKTFLISLVVALMMLPGTIIGILLGTLPPLLLTFFNAFTFGAIVYVVSDEIIPESHEHGFQKNATFALIVGILMVVMIGYM